MGMTQRSRSARRPEPRLRRLAGRPAAVAAASVMLAVVAGAPSASAQNVELGMTVYKTKVDCGRCHGWPGNGVPDDPRSPAGANLRTTQLTRDQLIEVIKCGRPGTGMPHFDARAYVDDRCYGVTREQLGDQTPPASPTSLIGREIEAVVDYMEAKIIGRGTITREECVEYFGDTPTCNEYPPAQ